MEAGVGSGGGCGGGRGDDSTGEGRRADGKRGKEGSE